MKIVEQMIKNGAKIEGKSMENAPPQKNPFKPNAQPRRIRVALRKKNFSRGKWKNENRSPVWS